ncbi:hypothetical protein PV326_001252 [Microctonus aethiopoides]|nr:hypothetical protein PV326_001252 [Microctonus aethiopoides]
MSVRVGSISTDSNVRTSTYQLETVEVPGGTCDAAHEEIAGRHILLIAEARVIACLTIFSKDGGQNLVSIWRPYNEARAGIVINETPFSRLLVESGHVSCRKHAVEST